MEEFTLHINLALENRKSLQINCTRAATAESICIEVCKALDIGTLARHLFALRLTNTSIYLAPSSTFDNELKALQGSALPVVPTVDFRMRYKVTCIARLKEQDPNAYDYYYFQARAEMLQCKVPGLSYERCRKELLGLSITDMLRVMLESGTARQIVEADYKKYVPKDILKKHHFFIKKPIHDNLVALERNLAIRPVDGGYVKAQYIAEFDTIAPDYLCEIHEAILNSVELDGPQQFIINIKVSPPHSSDPGLKYYVGSNLDKKESPKWIKLCRIEDLGFIAIRDDGSVELSRLNGIPIYLRFKSTPLMLSFVSLLDGYYRLACKWTFNLCQKLKTETLTNLYSMKCHGPVGGQFSYAKLESKTSNEVGCYIIRESETSYTTYYIDLCVKNNPKPKTLKVYRNEAGFLLENDSRCFNTIQSLIQEYSDSNQEIYFRECVPPSDYDLSQLLLCRKEDVVGDALADCSELLQNNTSPACISCKDLQVYKGQRKDGSRKLTHVYKGMWKAKKGQKMEIALKFLKPEQDKYLQEYINLVGQWVFLNSSGLVRYFGVCFSCNSVAPVMEYVKYGPLDEYLRENKARLKIYDLIEASSCLASAIWHLSNNGMVHGRVRCRKLMVHRHEENHFTVKLTDGGVFTSFDAEEVHWIALECYMDMTHQSTASDMWAMATTLYEIFTWGEPIRSLPKPKLSQNMKWYRCGNRLAKPADCPQEIYTIMAECWNADPQLRKKPQEVSRDINQLLYQVFSARHDRPYNMLTRPRGGSSQTIVTDVSTDDSTCELIPAAVELDLTSVSTVDGISASSQQLLLGFTTYPETEPDSIEDSASCLDSGSQSDSTEDVDRYWSDAPKSVMEKSKDSVKGIAGIFDLDGTHSVTLTGRLGQGYYGEVFKGIVENIDDITEPPVQVAVKKLKAFAKSRFTADFEREIEIMQTLKHPNIVQILSSLQDPDLLLVMEYVPHGSLQSYLSFNKDKLLAGQLLKFAYDIAMGMDYLGEKHIVHRDLAARNILVVDDSTVKISDFGLAQVLDSNDYYMLRSFNRNLPVKWYAPESLAQGKFSTRSDVWSYGITLYEMFLYGEDPPILGIIETGEDFQLPVAMMTALTNGERYPCPETCPQVIYVNLMRPCWEMEPRARPTFKQLIEIIINQMHGG